MTILVICEQRQGELKAVSLEAIAAARKFAAADEGVTALLLGSGIQAAEAQVASHGADNVVVVESPELQYYNYDAYKHAALAVMADVKPDIVVAAHTSQCMDFAPGLAVAAGIPMLSDCSGIERSGRELTAGRQLYGGKIEASYSLPLPCMVTVRQGSFPALPEGRQCEVKKRAVDFSGVMMRTAVRGYESPPKEDVDIEKARVIVSVGRGIEKKENLPAFEELVKCISGAVLAGSRPIIDNGWLPRGRQIGVSGKTVRPKLYIALGISGAIQHLSGMAGSEFIVAVNKDREAPIFKVANVGIADDIFKVVPALVSELKKG